MAKASKKKKEAKVKGRPSEYEETYPEMLIEHYKKGYSFESFGGVVGVSKQTLYTWTKNFPPFLDAKKRGEMASLLEWEKKGIEGMYHETFKDDDGMTITRNMNPSIWIFNMKNRFGWRDKVEIVDEDDDPEFIIE